MAGMVQPAHRACPEESGTGRPVRVAVSSGRDAMLWCLMQSVLAASVGLEVFGGTWGLPYPSSKLEAGEGH